MTASYSKLLEEFLHAHCLSHRVSSRRLTEPMHCGTVVCIMQQGSMYKAGCYMPRRSLATVCLKNTTFAVLVEEFLRLETQYLLSNCGEIARRYDQGPQDV